MQEYVDFILQVRDFDCEQLLRQGSVKGNKECLHSNSWRDLSLRSACIAAKDICQLSTAELTPAIIEATVMRTFTNRHYQFHSNEHFVQVRANVTSHMQSFFSNSYSKCEIMASFESFTVCIDELAMELTQYFHILYFDSMSNTYIVQRLMTEQNEQLLQLYIHLTTVFAAQAFHGAKLRIEALYPLSGEVLTWQPNMNDIEQSINYMAIFKTLLLDNRINSELLC